MDYYPFEQTCINEFNNGLTLALNIVLGLYVLTRMFGWCQDPLASELQKKIRQLEEENDALHEQVDELKDESGDLSENLKRANNSIQNLRNVLNEYLPSENDTQG